MTSNEWAAWVQAVGSILAIGASIVFWRLDAGERRRRDQLAQSALAAYIRLPVDEVMLFLESLENGTGEAKEYGGYRGKHQHLATFKIPKRLQQARSKTDSLGNLGPPLHGFIVDLGRIMSIGQALMHGLSIAEIRSKYQMELSEVLASARRKGLTLRMEIDRCVRSSSGQ